MFCTLILGYHLGRRSMSLRSMSLPPLHTHMNIYVCISICLHIHLCLYVCISICIHTHLCLYVCISICLHICIHTHLCLYSCIKAHVYTHTFTFIYMYTHMLCLFFVVIMTTTCMWTYSRTPPVDQHHVYAYVVSFFRGNHDHYMHMNIFTHLPLISIMQTTIVNSAPSNTMKYMGMYLYVRSHVQSMYVCMYVYVCMYGYVLVCMFTRWN